MYFGDNIRILNTIISLFMYNIVFAPVLPELEQLMQVQEFQSVPSQTHVIWREITWLVPINAMLESRHNYLLTNLVLAWPFRDGLSDKPLSKCWTYLIIQKHGESSSVPNKLRVKHDAKIAYMYA